MAREFNGSSQYISPAAELDITGTALTISAWVWVDTTTADMMIVCKGDANAYNFNFFLSLTNLGYLPDHGYLVFGYITGSLQHAAEGSTLVSTGQWLHLMGVYNGATQKVYINGVEDGSIAETGSMTQNNYAVKIGASPNIAGHTHYMDGRIAEVGIWNAGLNTSEIDALKKGISPAFIRSGSLLAYYPLIGESPEPDWKAGNNGTVTGATVVDHIAITYPQAEVNEWNKITAGGGVTVAPVQSDAAAASVNPTVILGSLALTPSADTAAVASVNPTVVLGSVSVTPTARTAAAATVAPTVALSSVSITPAASTAAAASVAPTVALASLNITPAASTAAAASANPTVVLGSLSITPAARTAAAATVAPTLAFGSTSATPSPSTAAAATVAPTVVLGSLALAPTARTAAAATVAPTVALSAMTVTPAVSSAVAASVAPTVVLGLLALAPTARTSAAASVSPTVVLGSVSIAPTPSAAATSSINPTVVGDGILFSPAISTAAASSVNPTVLYGSTTAAPTARTAAAATVAPTVVLSAMVVAPAARTAAAASVAPTVVYGSVSISPTVSSAAAATVNPVVLFGSTVATPLARSAATSAVIGAVLTSSAVVSPTPASATTVTLIGSIIVGTVPIPYVPEPPCVPFWEPPVARVPTGMFARIGTIDVPVVKASVTWKLSQVSEFSLSVPARSIDRRDCYFADVAVWEDGKVIISGVCIETPQIELDLQGVSMLSLRCIDEVGRLTTERAIITKHVQDEWLPQVVTDLLRVADKWQLGDYTTLINTGVHVTVDLRNKETLFAQVAEVVKSAPKTIFRYAGVDTTTGNRMLDIGFFNNRLHYLQQGDNLVTLKLQHNTAKLVRVLEAYSDALSDRRITLGDALQYPTINGDPDFAQFPIFYDGARGNYVIVNQALTRGCSIAKSFSMSRPKNDGIPSAAEIAAAGYGVWQRGVRFMQQSDDYITATATGLFEEIPQVGDRMYVRGKATETVWDTGTLNYREVETFDVEEEMRITQVSYGFEHVVGKGYVAGRPVPYYQCSVELTTSPYPEEYDDAATIVEAVQTFKQLDSSKSIAPSGALTYVTSSQSASASDDPDISCGGNGKRFTFAVPAAPAGAVSVVGNIISMSHPSANYSIVQAAAFPSTPLIICATVAGGWGSANLTVTAQFIFS